MKGENGVSEPCPKCGGQTDDTKAFCPTCGLHLEPLRHPTPSGVAQSGWSGWPLPVQLAVIVGACVVAAGVLAAVISSAAQTSKPVTVTYYVTGSAKEADITYTTASGDTAQQSNIDVPMVRKSDGGMGMTFHVRRGALLYLSAQNATERGDIRCAIDVDEREVATNTSYGGATIATCHATAR
jgi:hypothetical protein